MTDYVKSTNFTSKDSLSSGNPLKIIKGTEFDIEFNNIATAVGTKADIISPTFTGTPAAPTATAGTNTTQVATTAFVGAATTAERSATTTLTNKTISLTTNTVTGTKAEFNTACSDADFASLAGTETLTNKTTNLTSNTLTGTKAQFNTACSDTDFSFLNDFTGSNQSLSSDGYQKLPGGLIIQWGTFTPSSSTTSLTFPVAFSTACVSIQVMDRYDGDTGGGNQITALNAAPSTTGAVFSSSATVTLAYWLAIGY
jgi:hypothetical protein